MTPAVPGVEVGRSPSGEDLKHDRQVAIKVLKPELAAVVGADRFVQEIKTTAARRPSGSPGKAPTDRQKMASPVRVGARSPRGITVLSPHACGFVRPDSRTHEYRRIPELFERASDFNRKGRE